MLFCLDEIVFSIIVFFLLVVTIIEIIRKPIFTEKLHCSQQKLFFWLVKNRFFFIYQIFQRVKTVSPRGNVFLMNFSFRLVETDSMSSRNSIIFFRALLKILKFGGSNLFKRKLISARGNLFFSQQKLIFYKFPILLLVKGILSSGKVFLNEFFIPYG